LPPTVVEEDETVAAIEHITIVAVASASKVEALNRDAVGRVKDGDEHDPLVAVSEGAE